MIRGILVLGSLWAATLCGQSRFSWQDYCFKNPAAPVCRSHDYAVKPPARAKDAAPRTVVTTPFPSTSRTVTPSMILAGAIDWRFADPFADALVGFNFSGLSASPLAHSLITLLGTRQGLTEADLQKIFDGLSNVDQVALSVRNDRIVAMVTGHVADSALPAPEAGLKAVPVSGGVMLFGHTDAVDQALQRIHLQRNDRKGPSTELAQLAAARQATSQFWAIISAAQIGAQAVKAGVKRFSLTVSIRDRVTSDAALEFNGPPGANAVRTWQTKLGSAATVEGSAIHVRASMEAAEVQQKFTQIAAGPLGQGLAALVQAARYIPVPDPSVPKLTKPKIYGLDDGNR